MPAAGTKKDKKPTSANPVVAVQNQGQDPFVGKTVGHCLLQEKIAEGGSAHIYKATNTSFDLPRVVKILKPSLVYEEENFLHFKQEAQFTARLDHPNIRRVYDTGEIDGHFYIEMDFIEGMTLREYVSAKSKIPETQVLSIALQIAQALEYAHNIQIQTTLSGKIEGILHRDIKPENIIITPTNHVYLMDFGAAKPLNLTSNSMQGMVVGTFHYMSPEQIQGKPMDARSDFFSLGIVMYELLAGTKPFTAENLIGLVEKIKSSRYMPLRKRRRSISPLTQELVDNLLSKNKVHRPSSASEIIKDLKICIQAYESWGRGDKVKVPFSLKKFFPSLSLIISLVALCFSLMAYFRTPGLVSTKNGKQLLDSSILLEEARELEDKKLWKAAISRYESVPSPERGGRPDEYLESRIKIAILSYSYFNQFTKARNILESLRLGFSDPAIDVYLGEVYFKLALYDEAVTRLEYALNSSKGTIMDKAELKKEAEYFRASSLDGKYTFVDKSEPLLSLTIEAWEDYSQNSFCKKKPDKSCEFATKRLAELSKLMTN